MIKLYETTIQKIVLCLLVICLIFNSQSYLFANEQIEKSYPNLNLSNLHLSDYVRVALIKGATTFELVFMSSFIVSSKDNEKKYVLFSSSRAKIVFKKEKDFININGHKFKVNKILIEALDNKFVLNGNSYAGSISIINKSDGLLVVNNIDLEKYLNGVLPSEVDPKWEMAALKAQAVASRTYAVFNEILSASKDYSLEKSVLSQVYSGEKNENEKTRRAILETNSEILTYKGDIFSTFFHANCGGKTEDVENVWGYYPFEALSSVRCLFCEGTKHFFWQKKIPLELIRAKLLAGGIEIGKIHSVYSANIDRSGRVTKFLIFAKGKNIYISGNKFRLLMGAEYLRSTRIKEMKTERYKGKYYLLISGYGWGHGVGMCQWGAKVMADSGYNYVDILRYYYKGSKIEKI